MDVFIPQHTTKPVLPKKNFLTALTYYLNKFLNKVNIPYSQRNILISLISQALIGPYLIHSLHTPLFAGEGEVDPGVTFFQESCCFYINNKLKYVICNDKKKLIKKNIFLCNN